MIRLRFPSPRKFAWGLVLAAAAPVAAQDNDAVGVVRISKASSAKVRAQSDEISPANCQSGPVTAPPPDGLCQWQL